MCKKCKLEAERYHDTHKYVPKWKRHFTATPKQTWKCICSAQSGNLRNLEIALRILGIPRLRTIVARSRDCAIHLRDLEIAQL